MSGERRTTGDRARTATWPSYDLAGVAGCRRRYRHQHDHGRQPGNPSRPGPHGELPSPRSCAWPRRPAGAWSGDATSSHGGMRRRRDTSDSIRPERHPVVPSGRLERADGGCGTTRHARLPRQRAGRGHGVQPQPWRGAAGFARPSTTSTPGSVSRIDDGRDHLPAPAAAAEHDPLALHDGGVHPDREAGRQPEHGHAADLVPGQRRGSRPARQRTTCARTGPSRPGSRRGGGWPARRTRRRRGSVALAHDDDRVGGVLDREAVGGAERGRVGQGRVAGEELVLAAAGEGGLQGVAIRIGPGGHGAER